MTPEQIEKGKRRSRLAFKLVEEAWKVVRALKGHKELFPVDGLEASLLAIDAEMGITREEEVREAPTGSSPLRVLRRDMEVGRDYILIRKGQSEVPFKYLGNGGPEIIGEGSDSRKIRIQVGDDVKEMFWSDAGLEPYRPGCPDEWWGPNWVRRADLDDRDVDGFLKGLEGGDLDLGADNPLFLPTEWDKH